MTKYSLNDSCKIQGLSNTQYIIYLFFIVCWDNRAVIRAVNRAYIVIFTIIKSESRKKKQCHAS